ncbi:MAG: hypothetical protein R3C58_15540 [Parvularculaceae bacterium]
MSADTPLVIRFRDSMIMDYDKWHDGIGYDLDAIAEAGPSERAAIEAMVIAHQPRDWRDVEALAALDTPAARAALIEAADGADAQTRMAVARHAPRLMSDKKRAASLVRAIETTAPFEGLAAILDEAENFHPPEVITALLRAARGGDGEAAVNIAALLLYLHGRAESAFDWDQRPFFLRFNTDDRAQRDAAYRDLCAMIGVDPELK